jgi:hypothetical protein
MSTSPERIYDLLPAVYRLRDAEQDDPLKMLLAVIAEQVDVVEDDIEQLYENWFIETCDEWVVPYIGDLLGVQGLHQISAAGFTQRARVANTLSYRRRKGTATMLEQLARDTTLWAARAVEFFELLGTTQYLNHIRLHNLHTPDLRDLNTLQLLDTPFDTIAHTVDVRRIATGRGKHNIPNVGLFLWRLQDYEVRESTPRQVASPGDGRYTFTPIGHNAPLFNQPLPEETIDHLAEETDVPGAIRPLAFYLDLANYRGRYTALETRPPRSTYYGPDTSLSLTRDSLLVPPIDIACMDLRSWARPPARMTGLLSGALAPFPAISAPASATTPAVNVTIGSEGPHAAVLAAVPGSLSDAALLLEEAIQHAHTSVDFTAARVTVIGDHLLVLPGIRGSAVTFAPAPGDATSVSELQLDTATAVQGALSARLKPFPRITGGRLNVTIGGSGPFELNLGAIPASVADAAVLLETAIQTADPAPAFANARVVAADDSLLVIPGAPGGIVTFTPVADDPATVYELGLANRIGIDVRLGRIAFPLGDVPGSLLVSYTYGFSGDIGGGPYDRRVIRRPEEPPLLAYEDTVTAPDGLGVRLEVPTSFSTIGQALTEWETVLGRPDAVIEIVDSGTYEEDLTINMAATDLVIQARNRERPALIGDITVNGGEQGRLTFNGLLAAGGLTVAEPDCLRQLDVAHCTFAPGHTLSIDRQPQMPQEPSIVVSASNPVLQITISQSISGPLRLPANIDSLLVQDSIIESPYRDKPASIIPALVSGSLSPFPSLVPAKPALRVTIGENGPFTVKLASKPTTLAAARDRLQQAIRSAHSSPAFAEARIISAKNRLIVLPGVPAVVSIEPTDTDDTADKLRLSSGNGVQTFALISGSLPSSFSLSEASPTLVVTVEDTDHTVSLSPVPGTLAQARDALKTAISTASLDPAFSSAIVGSIDETGQLVVLPGVEGKAVYFGAASGDTATVTELKLECDLPAIAGNRTGEQPGPSTALERVTVLGTVHVRDLALASEVIFTGVARADRRQTGCVRFSYVPPGSRTPRRYRCQPDLEISTQIADAEEKALAEGVTLSQAQKAVIRQRILQWLVPAFTTTEFGQPAYGQLSLTCAAPIRTGAEDGSEMGAFSFLKQPQREANLRASLDEYLRFGLEAGIFYVT